MKSRKPLSPKRVAQLKAMQAARVGTHHTAEARARMSASQTGRKHSAETRAKISAANKGKHALGHCCTPEHRAKISAALRGRKHSAEHRAKLSAAAKRRYADPAKHPRWLGGVSREPYSWNYNAELREEVRRRDGYKCQKCGVPQAECERALDIHHVDYDKKNSDPVNLISLCRSCHLKTNTNRTQWTAVFQAMAIKRSIAELEGRK